jgi:adhesin transport system outer membrane protein
MVVYFCAAGGALANAAETPPQMPLHEILEIVTETNPEILEALERYHSVKAERTIATSGYWPTVGTELAAGPEVTEGVQTNDVRENLTAARATLYARQNLWSGGKTMAFVAETDARILAAAYEVANVANRIYLETTEAYIQVLKARRLLKFSEENVLTQGKILEQVKEKTEAGFNRISDLKNSEARLALSRGNYVSKQQDLNQAVVQFHRQFGRLVKPEQFVAPKPKYQFPETVEETVDIALRHHPALEVAKYNIQVRKYAYEKAKADYWPTLDLVLEARHHDNVNGDVGETDQASAMLKLNYTFFDGGARKGEKGKNYGNLNKEYQRAYVERRNVNQTTRLAWNTLQAETHKRQYLQEHVDLSLETLQAFKDEYFIGRRTLLDLLNMENEYNAAKNANAESRYAHLTAYYRISQATGLMLDEYDTGLRDHMQLPPKKLYDLKGYAELDRNRDFDSVQDVTDQCDNTVLGTRTESSGCAQEKVFTVGYQAPTELSPYILPEEGTPEELNLKIDRTKDKQSIHMDIIYFPSNSSELNAETRQMLVPIAAQLNKAAEDFVIEVIGHTDSTASAEHNRKLSVARALSVYNELIRLGIDKRRLVASGKGEHEPIASNATEEGKRKNRRIEFKLRKKTGPVETKPPPDSSPVPDVPATAPVPDVPAVAPAPAEPSPYIVPEEGTPEALNLRIDRTKKKQSIQLDLIQFASDSPALTDDIRIVLKHIASQLIAADAFSIEVIGHTDDTASAAHNQKLSQARAQSVANELIRLGVPKERLAVSGRGEYDPIVPNSTEEGKRKNRRIEFKLTKK